VPVIQADSRPLRVKPDNAGGMQVAGKDESILSGKSDDQATLAPAPETPAPQALTAATNPAPGPVAMAPAVSAPSMAAPAPPPAPPAPVAKVAAAAKPSIVIPPARGPQVQLAALTSEQSALAEWQRLEKKAPDMFGGRKPEVLRTERDGKTFWRLRTGGFADATQAKTFCEQVKAKGMGCAVASF
jgi:hypothetical protein